MPVSAQTIMDQFPELVNLASGSADSVALHPTSSASPNENSLVYVADKFHLSDCLKVSSIVVTTQKIADSADTKSSKATLLITKDASVAMALINQHFFPTFQNYSPTEAGAHSSATISSSAKIGANCSIGPGAILGDNCVVGDNTRIGANSVVEAGAQIGNNCHLHSLTYIGPDCKLGNECVIHPNTVIGCEGYGLSTDTNWQHQRKPHYGKVVLGDRVEIGANVSVDRGAYGDTVIGSGTKMDNHCHIAHNVQIGENNLITAGFIVAGSTTIGDRNMFGGRVSVNGHIRIGSDNVFAGASVIAGHVETPGRYGGYPLQDYKQSLKSIASRAKLPELRQDIKQIKKELDELKNS